MKKFRCMPIAIGLPIIFIALSLLWVYLGFLSDVNWVNSAGEAAPLGGRLLCTGMVVLSLGVSVFTLKNALWRVEIFESKIVCKGLFPWDTFVIPYESCNVGMDFHKQNSGKMWWIYICNGSPAQYKPGKPSVTMNAVKIQPGFIKILYDDAVYTALLEVLPKKQKTSLMTARCCAGFDKQGSII